MMRMPEFGGLIIATFGTPVLTNPQRVFCFAINYFLDRILKNQFVLDMFILYLRAAGGFFLVSFHSSERDFPLKFWNNVDFRN